MKFTFDSRIGFKLDMIHLFRGSLIAAFAFAIFSANLANASSLHDQARSNSDVRKGQAEMLMPTSNPQDFVKDKSKAKSDVRRPSGEGPTSSQIRSITAFNPDPEGDGIEYSTYADNPNTDVALINLALNLGNDPVRMYEWVRNNVRTEFYYGGNRGAYLTFLERAGNDVDQCALLGALFKAAGFVPEYRLDYMWAPRSGTGVNSVGVYEWIGVTDDASALNVLGLHSATFDTTNNMFRFIAMWVSIDIPGRGRVRFFPFVKPHSVGRRPNLDALSGYALNAAISAASASTTTSPSPAINSGNLRAHLGALAAQASSAIRSSAGLHDLSGAELARLPIIVPEVVTITAPTATRYPEGILYNDDSLTTPLTGIPTSYLGHIKLSVGNYTHWFEGGELLGKPLSVEFNGAGTGVIVLGGTILAQETSGTTTQNVAATLAYEVPIAYQGGASVIFSRTISVVRQNSIAVAYGFGAMQPRLQKTLEDNTAEEAANPADVTQTDRLQIIGQQYLSQCDELSSLGSSSLAHRFIRTAQGGFVFIRNSKPILDAGLNVGNFYAQASSAPATSSVMSAINTVLGALEGTAIEQMSGQRAFGTPTLFDYAMTLGGNAYLFTSLAQLNQVRNSLQNFNDTTLGAGAVTAVENHLSAGGKILLLGNSSVTLGGFTGGGYFEIHSSGGVGSMIVGAAGGAATGPTGTASVGPTTNAASTTETKTVIGQPQSPSKDPVDLTNGAFLKNDTDLVLGKGEPNGLRLERSYNSARRASDPVGMGRGWNHNYGMKMTLRSPNDLDATRASVDEVLPILIAVRLAQDIAATESTARGWLMTATALTWAADQQINTRASISLGARSMEFVKMPNGLYAPPPGIAATLTKQSGDSSHDLAFRHGNTVHFRPSDGKFTSIADQFGNTLSATYDGSNRLQTVADAYNRSLTFLYDGGGRLYQVNDSTGRNVQYGRTPEGHFTFTDAEGQQQRYEMNADFLLTRIVDARSRTVVENDYDFWKRVWRQRTFGDAARTTNLQLAPNLGVEIDPAGNSVATYFDAKGRKIFQVDQLHHLGKWEYDGADRLIKVTTPRGSTTAFAYDANHVLVSETNPAGHTRTIVPDGQSRPWKVRNFEGKETVFTYTTQHLVETVTLPGGIVSSYTYDTRGRVQTLHPAAYAAGAVDTYTYDANGNLDKITYPANGFDDYTFNARGDLTELTDRNGAKTTFGYNNRRQRTSVTQWKGTAQLTAQTFYDAAGDVDYTLDPAGRKVDSDYDALGHLLTLKRGAIGSQVTTLANIYEPARVLLNKARDAFNNETTFVYDAAERLTDSYDPLNRRRQQAYDFDGNPTTGTTPLTFASTVTYDARGFKDAVSDAELQLVDYTYDKDGRLTTLANRLNQPFTWVYDDDNRTVTVKTPLLKTTVETRNTRGLLATVQAPSTLVTTFTTYDTEGRLTGKTDGVGATTYTYWPNGLLKEVVEGGRTTYRGYDELNRLSEYRDGEGNSITYEYTAASQLWKLHYPGGNTVTYGYDDFGRLWHVTDWANRVTTYTYDNASRLTRIDRPNGTYRIQDYDAASQLRFVKEYKSDNTVLTFAELRYDADGRIDYWFQHPKLGTVTLAQDALLYDNDNRLSSWNGQTPVFDADGNMTTGPLPDGTFGTYAYDARDRLTSAGGSTYRYNPDGLRMQITGAGAATFVVDPNAALSRTLMRTKGGVTTFYVYGLGLLYEETAGVTKTYHADHLGSTVAITSNGTTVTDRVSYSPFGLVISRIGSTDTPFLLHGQHGVVTDTSGLCYMRARYYNSRLMRFVNADPIKFDGGSNWYAFVANNPVSHTDPTGTIVETVWDVANLGIGTASLGYNLHHGNYGWAVVDTVGLIYDGFATAVPFLPAGASAGVKAFRAGNSVAHSTEVGMDVARIANKANDAAKAVDVAATARAAGTSIHREVAIAVQQDVKMSESLLSHVAGSNGARGLQADFRWGNAPGIWADITTMGQWGKHLDKYEPLFGEGISIIYQRGVGVVGGKMFAGAGVALGGQSFGDWLFGSGCRK